jgi:hypothetical protein
MAALTPSERVEQWRKAKRKQGYRAITLWVPFHAKGEFDALAYSRNQDPGQCFLDAVRALAATMGKTPEVRLESHQRHLIAEEAEDRVIKRLVAAGMLPGAALATPSAVPAPTTREPLPPGWKQCSNPTHPPYDTTAHDECPEHGRERKQRYLDKKKAQQRTG